MSMKLYLHFAKLPTHQFYNLNKFRFSFIKEFAFEFCIPVFTHNLIRLNHVTTTLSDHAKQLFARPNRGACLLVIFEWN